MSVRVEITRCPNGRGFNAVLLDEVLGWDWTEEDALKALADSLREIAFDVENCFAEVSKPDATREGAAQ